MVEKMEMREEVPEEEVEDDDCFGNRKGAWRRKLSSSALARRSSELQMRFSKTSARKFLGQLQNYSTL
jgi:hypothetical protein